MRPSGARLSIEQAARGSQEPAQVRSSAGAAQLRPEEGSRLPIRRTRVRSGWTGAPRCPGAGTPIRAGTCLPPCPGIEGTRGAGRGLSYSSHPAPGHGSCGEAAPWAGARGEQAGGAPAASTRTGRGPQERLDRGACSTGPRRRRRHLASFRPARATGRSSDRPRARPPARHPRRDRSPESDAEQPRLRGTRLSPAIPPRQSRR